MTKRNNNYIQKFGPRKRIDSNSSYQCNGVTKKSVIVVSIELIRFLENTYNLQRHDMVYQETFLLFTQKNLLQKSIASSWKKRSKSNISNQYPVLNLHQIQREYVTSVNSFGRCFTT